MGEDLVELADGLDGGVEDGVVGGGADGVGCRGGAFRDGGISGGDVRLAVVFVRSLVVLLIVPLVPGLVAVVFPIIVLLMMIVVFIGLVVVLVFVVFVALVLVLVVALVFVFVFAEEVVVFAFVALVFVSAGVVDEEAGGGAGSLFFLLLPEGVSLELASLLSIPPVALVPGVDGIGIGWPSVDPVLRLDDTVRHTLNLMKDRNPHATHGVNVVTNTSVMLVTGLETDVRLVLTGVEIRLTVMRKTMMRMSPEKTRVTMKAVYPVNYFPAVLYAVLVRVIGLNMTVISSRVPWTSSENYMTVVVSTVSLVRKTARTVLILGVATPTAVRFVVRSLTRAFTFLTAPLAVRMTLIVSRLAILSSNVASATIRNDLSMSPVRLRVVWPRVAGLWRTSLATSRK